MRLRWLGSLGQVVVGVRARAVLGLALGLVGCSSKARAPYVDASPKPPGAMIGQGGDSSLPTSSGGATGSDSTAGGNLDPYRVYLIGAAGNVGIGVADLASPKTYTLSVPSVRAPYVMHNTLLYYLNGPYELVPDYTGSDPPDSVDVPMDALMNDHAVDAPCADATEKALRYLPGPDGQLMYLCSEGWYLGGAVAAPYGLEYRALGHNGLVLIWDKFTFQVQYLKDRKGIPIAGEHPIAVRASANGFIYVVSGLHSLELHEVDTKGVVKVRGNYPQPLASTNLGLENAQLDGQGNLFLHGVWADTTKKDYLVVQMVLGGATRVVYQSKVDEPNIVIDSNTEGLFTGP